MRGLFSRVLLCAMLLFSVSAGACDDLMSSFLYEVPEGLRIHFIDVGQADAVLVETPSGRTMLVDAGNNGDGDDVVAYLRGQGIARLDVVVGTHPHADHIGGMDTVIKEMDIGTVYMPRASANTRTFEDVLLAVRDKGLRVQTAAAGIAPDLGEDVQVIMLAPNSTDYDELNNASAVIKITYGEVSALLTGDAEALSEREMLDAGYDVSATLLKVGHHGSGTSSCKEFLEAVKPRLAVISCGKDNEYGHPHDSVLSRLSRIGARVYRTDELGTIVAASDGYTFVIE